jgi:hypothetical protein
MQVNQQGNTAKNRGKSRGAKMQPWPGPKLGLLGLCSSADQIINVIIGAQDRVPQSSTPRAQVFGSRDGSQHVDFVCVFAPFQARMLHRSIK